jgi:hypothetical protein
MRFKLGSIGDAGGNFADRKLQVRKVIELSWVTLC